MQEEAFKSWLLARGADAEAARNTRVYAVRTIENHLQDLGSPHADLDAAWNADRFEQLRERIRRMREDFQNGGTDYRVLMPQSENPINRLSNWRSWLGQYGQFLSGEPAGDRDADRIRQYVLEHYIEPARQRDENEVEVLVRNVNEAMDLNQAWPNICQAMKGTKFLAMADVAPPEQIGVDQSPATVFRFRLDGISPEVADGRPFLLFDSAGAAFKPVRHHNRQTGRSAYRLKPKGASNLAEDALEVDTIAEVARGMLVDDLPARVQSTGGGPVNYLGYGRQRLVRYELDPRIAAEIGVPPIGSVAGLADEEPALPTGEPPEKAKQMTPPTNLILYGPPGTGKTHATAEEAVRLCGEPVPDDRDALMTSYRRLLEAGRIEFVTFHQSVSYEDFVEGLRPTQSNEEGGAGFELKPEQGVFRRIARRAETSTGSGEIQFTLDGRQIFKMSIGEAANPEDAHLFEEAMEGGYALLGFEDIDWSDDRFASRDEIINAVRQLGKMGGGEPNSSSGRVQMPFIFRNTMKAGDIVVVSKGNSLFRAIGEVVGDYEFVPREGGTYAHRRAVRWLWIDRTGVPVSEIYSRTFSQKSIYILNESELNIPALERYVASQQSTGQAEPEPFVLILDEINRANISKVFGELITLLEPDKRLGQRNGLKVRLPYSGEMFGVPSNLHVVGTMNTADRSIALLDTALRRRFQFKELMPNPSLLGIIAGVNLQSLLRTVNERIEYLFDREHQIGHAYFMACTSRDDIDAVMRHKVIPLLAEYFYEDWAKVAAVLGDAYEGDGDREGRFIDRRQLKPPRGLGDVDEATPRFRWTVRDAFSYEGFA
jgi:5-methylcytosine-specific restriction protein B